MTAMPVRWGIMGTGGIAHLFAADLAFTQSGRLVAVGSRLRDSARQFAEAHGVGRWHGSYEALAADPEVEAVYIATPVSVHHQNATLALGGGKAVLVEKPFTLNGAQARSLVQFARSQELFLMEAMWTRFLPHIHQIRSLLADGALGTAISLIADFGAPFDNSASPRIFTPELGGGALLELGVYPVSLASLIFGEPDRVLSLITPSNSGVDAQTSMLLGYAGGQQAMLTCTISADTPSRASISGTKARIEMERHFHAPSSFSLITRDGQISHFRPPHRGHGLWYEADEVARCMRAGLFESPLMPNDETITIMETMDHILRVLDKESNDRG